MKSQCGPRRPNVNETKMRRRYDVACRVGWFFLTMSTFSANETNDAPLSLNLAEVMTPRQEIFDHS